MTWFRVNFLEFLLLPALLQSQRHTWAFWEALNMFVFLFQKLYDKIPLKLLHWSVEQVYQGNFTDTSTGLLLFFSVCLVEKREITAFKEITLVCLLGVSPLKCMARIKI